MADPFALLPNELFLHIIDIAISAFLIEDRPALGRLAQTSREIYNRVVPALY